MDTNDPHKKPKKIVKFPTLAERDRIRKQQDKDKSQTRKSSNTEPFFNFGNIPPFAKFITIALIATHLLAAILLDDGEKLRLIFTFGFIPGMFTGTFEWSWAAPLSPILYNFIHSDWTHVGFNAIMGLALCTFVEKMFSTQTTIKFFFLCGIGGAAIYFILNPTTHAPVIGASGSTSGLFAAALMMMYEQGRFGAFTGKFANKGPWPIIGIWTAIMVLLGLLSGGIAWEAHIGGFLTGSALYYLMRTNRLRL